MKLGRIDAEITRTRERIDELQDRLKDLERRKTEAENTEIVAVVRSADISHQELLAFIHAYRARGVAAESMLETGPEQEDYEDEET